MKNRYDFSTETRNDWLILSYFQLSDTRRVRIFVRRVFRETNEVVLFTLWFTFFRDEFFIIESQNIDKLYS